MTEKRIRRIKERPVIHKVEPSNRIKRVAVYASIHIQADRTVEIEGICGNKMQLRLSEGSVTGKRRAFLDTEGK